MKKQNKKGLWILAGIAASAAAYWSYISMSPSKKKKLKSRLNETGNKIAETVENLEKDIRAKNAKTKKSAKKVLKKVAG